MTSFLEIYCQVCWWKKFDKNSSGDEMANVNFYAVHPGSYPNSPK